EVVAAGGGAVRGGDDFDRTLVDRLGGTLLEQARIDLRARPDGWAKLTMAAEQIKCQLSRDEVVAGTIHDLAVGVDGRGVSLDFEMSRQEFEAMIAPYVERSLLACDEV